MASLTLKQRQKKTKRKTRTKTKTLEVRLDVDLSRPPSLQEGLYRFTIRQRQRQSECLVSFTEMCFKCTFRELAFSREVSGRGTTNPNFVYTCKYAFVPTFNATVTINTAALQWLCWWHLSTTTKNNKNNNNTHVIDQRWPRFCFSDQPLVARQSVEVILEHLARSHSSTEMSSTMGELIFIFMHIQIFGSWP